MIYMRLLDQRSLLNERRREERRIEVRQCIEAYVCRRGEPDRRSEDRRASDRDYCTLWIDTFWAKRLELHS